MSQEILITNLSRPQAQPVRATYCDSFLGRLRGLMFRRSLPERTGVLLVQSRESRMDASIHMFFMWMDLAVVWIDAQRRVVDVRLARRWMPAYLPQRPARYVLELPAGCQADFATGDVLEFTNRDAV